MYKNKLREREIEREREREREMDGSWRDCDRCQWTKW